MKNYNEIMIAQEIPENKRQEYYENTRGLMNKLFGSASATSDAINQAQEQGLRGEDAVKYIDSRIQKQNEDLSKILIRSSSGFI